MHSNARVRFAATHGPGLQRRAKASVLSTYCVAYEVLWVREKQRLEIVADAVSNEDAPLEKARHLLLALCKCDGGVRIQMTGANTTDLSAVIGNSLHWFDVLVIQDLPTKVDN